MQVELPVHLVYRDNVLQVARIMFHCAFDTEDADPFLHLGSLSKSKCIDTAQISHPSDLSVSIGIVF